GGFLAFFRNFGGHWRGRGPSVLPNWRLKILGTRVTRDDAPLMATIIALAHHTHRDDLFDALINTDKPPRADRLFFANQNDAVSDNRDILDRLTLGDVVDLIKREKDLEMDLRVPDEREFLFPKFVLMDTTYDAESADQAADMAENTRYYPGIVDIFLVMD